MAKAQRSDDYKEASTRFGSTRRVLRPQTSFQGWCPGVRGGGNGVRRRGIKASEGTPGCRGSPSSSPLTSLRVSSGGTQQRGLSARWRYSITVAVGREVPVSRAALHVSSREALGDISAGGVIYFARGHLYLAVKCVRRTEQIQSYPYSNVRFTSIPTCPPEQEKDTGAVLLHLGCTVDHFKKCRCSSVPLLPIDADVTGLGCGRGTFIFEKLPGASNVQPGLSMSEF